MLAVHEYQRRFKVVFDNPAGPGILDVWMLKEVFNSFGYSNSGRFFIEDWTGRAADVFTYYVQTDDFCTAEMIVDTLLSLCGEEGVTVVEVPK